MLDVTMLTLVVACFVMAKAYADLCDHVVALSAAEDVSP
jgi:hypothetical protein